MQSNKTIWKKCGRLVVIKKVSKYQEEALRKIIREEIQKEKLEEGALDWLQGGLDVVGLIPGIGEAADGVNAAISLARGNPLEAALSLVSMIPVAGDAVGKGGKLVLKLLDPAMDLIKAGGKAADIIKKIGPDKIKKATGALNLVKDTLVKNKSKIQKGFEAVKKADLESIEKIINVKIPDIARSKVEKEIKKAAAKIDAGAIGNVIKFLTDLSGEEAVVTSESYAPRGYEGSLASIGPHILGEEYVKRELEDLYEFFLNSGENT